MDPILPFALEAFPHTMLEGYLLRFNVGESASLEAYDRHISFTYNNKLIKEVAVSLSDGCFAATCPTLEEVTRAAGKDQQLLPYARVHAVMNATKPRTTTPTKVVSAVLKYTTNPSTPLLLL